MSNRYFYSENGDPSFGHVIRCQAQTGVTPHDGIEWLRDIQKTIEILELEEGTDYERIGLGLLAFPTHEGASQFYACLTSELGSTHRQLGL